MTTSNLSDAGKALFYLSEQLDDAEYEVQQSVNRVFQAQQSLRDAIDHRDAIQKTLNLTAAYMQRETT